MLNRNIISNIGTIFGKKYDLDKSIYATQMELLKIAPALEFINSSGWEHISDKYRELMSGVELHMKNLCKDVEKNKDEIQRQSDFLDACTLLLDMVQNVIDEHESKLIKLNTDQGTAQNIKFGTPKQRSE